MALLQDFVLLLSTNSEDPDEIQQHTTAHCVTVGYIIVKSLL